MIACPATAATARILAAAVCLVIGYVIGLSAPGSYRTGGIR